MNSSKLELLDYLSKYSIVLGILDSEGQKQVEVNVVNTDNTTSTTQMTIRDIMYLTELGTITIPGKHILEKTLPPAKRIIKETLEVLVAKIMNDDVDEDYITNQINELCLKVQDLVRNYMAAFIGNNNRLGQIIHKDVDENKYLYNLNELKKYVRCIAKFEN